MRLRLRVAPFGAFRCVKRGSHVSVLDSCARRLLGLFDPDQVRDRRESCRARRRLSGNVTGDTELAQSPSPRMVRLCVLGAVDAASNQRDAQLDLAMTYSLPNLVEALAAQRRRPSSALRSCLRASIVA